MIRRYFKDYVFMWEDTETGETGRVNDPVINIAGKIAKHSKAFNIFMIVGLSTALLIFIAILGTKLSDCH